MTQRWQTYFFLLSLEPSTCSFNNNIQFIFVLDYICKWTSSCTKSELDFSLGDLTGRLCNYSVQVTMLVMFNVHLFGVGSLLPSCNHAGASCVFAAAAAQSVWGDVQPGCFSHLHPRQLHPPDGAGQGLTDWHTRWKDLLFTVSLFSCSSLVLSKLNIEHNYMFSFPQSTRRCVTQLWYLLWSSQWANRCHIITTVWYI